MRHVKCYRQNYPRPQFVRDSFVSLDGEWFFAFDDSGEGEREAWQCRTELERTIRVPFSYHTAASGIGETDRHDCVWYLKKLPDFSGQLAGRRLMLNFEGADYETKVWVNGRFLGSHRGGYDRFSFDATNALTDGDNYLAVRVADSFETDRPRGKQRWQSESFACFYVETTGLWKSVWCELVPENCLRSLRIAPNLDEGKVSFTYSFRSVAPDLTVQTIVSMDGQTVADVTSRAARKTFSLDVSLVSEAHFFKVFSWRAADPRLYDVELVVRRGEEVVDRIGSYFGVHKAECRENLLYCGNVPEYLRMVLAQGYWEESGMTPPNEQALERDAELILQLGFNGVRVHEKIEDERFYYYCDVLGLYATCEMPSFYEYTDAAMQDFSAQWERTVISLRNHPCLIMWVPFNESWGLYNISASLAEQRFADAMCALSKALDGRPVVSNDGWEHTTSDIVTLHNYAETGGELAASYADLAAVLRGGAVSGEVPRSAFAKGYAYAGQPVMLTEFGGVAFERDAESGWGYGSYARDGQTFLARLAGLVNAILRMPAVSGYCLTQFTDVEQEKNGLLTMDRRPKADPEALRALFSRRLPK